MEHEEVKFKQEASNQSLVFTQEHLEFLKEKLNSEIIKVEQLSAKGSQNSHYQIETKDTKKYILRKGLTERPVNEYKRLKVLQELSLDDSNQVSPKVFALDESKKYLDSPYTVMEFVEGQTERLGDKITTESFQRAAKALKKIHSVPVENFQDKEEFRMWENWRGEKVISDNDFKQSQSSPHEFYKNYYREILEKTEHLIPLIQSCPKRLVHGDGHMGNMRLVSSGEYRLMDWELTHVGNSVMDLGTFITESVLNEDQVKEFLEAYGYDLKDENEMAVLWWWRMFRAASILSYLIASVVDLSAPEISPWLQKYWSQIEALMKNIPLAVK